MARIPMGNFGGAVARAPSAARIGIGQDLQDATQRIGSTVQGIALDQMQAQTRLDEQERQRQEAAAEAAARGQEALALQNAADQLTDLHDEVAGGIRDGTVPKDQAEKTWTDKADKMVRDAGTKFRPESRDLVSAKLQGVAARLGNGVRKAREQRDRQDVTASLDGILESTAREYARDPATATAKAQGALATLGPQSTYTPDVIGRKGQQWLEAAQYTTGYELVSLGRNDRSMLDVADRRIAAMESLDPQKRAQLLDRSQAYRLHLDQQDEMRANRAAREGERRLKHAEAEFNTFQALADKGTVLAPEYIDRVMLATAGTPYQGGIKALAQQARETGGFAAQPVRAQQAALDALDVQIASGGRSPEIDKRREQLAKVLTASREDLRKDGLRAGLERGVIASMPPINMSGGLSGLVAGLQERAPLADRVQQWAGQSVSPMTSDEAAATARMLSSLPMDQKGAAVSALSSAISPQQAGALARQMDAQDKPLALALAAGSSKTTQGRTVAELILRGAQVAKDRGVKEDTTAEFGVRATLAKEVGDSVPAAARADVIDAARLIYLAKQGEGQSISAAGAVRLAIGGDIVEHNGRRLPVPAGVTDLAARLQTYPRAAIDSQAPDGFVYLPGGRPMGVPEFLVALPSAQLEPDGLGRYLVRSGGSLVMNQDRRPIVVEAR